MISARVCTDDGVVHEEFDATWYFEQATFLDLVNLEGCGWGGDYPADDVAEFCRKRCKKLFNYLELVNSDQQGDLVGFECHINREHVLEWLKEHRPPWYRLFKAHDDNESLKYLALLANASKISTDNGSAVWIITDGRFMVVDQQATLVGTTNVLADAVAMFDQVIKAEKT